MVRDWLPATLIGLGVGGVLLLAGTARGHAAPANHRVALIGDSYAVGLGPRLAQLVHDFKWEGHVGTNTAQWASRKKACGQCGEWLAAYRPAVVLVSLGVNDNGLPLPANYQAIVQELHGLGALVVWIEPPAGVPNVDAVRAIIHSLGVPTVPATDSPLTTDNVHPTSYGPWAHEVARRLTQ